MLDHRNIIRFYGNFQDKVQFYVVLELMQGGNLLDRIVEKKTYTEEVARNACKQIFEAVEYCHFHRIVHRDLKPENLLLMSTTEHADIKIGDFGFASFMFVDDSLKTMCGTPSYVAPEILQQKKYGA